MRGRIIRFLLGTLYVVLLAALLITHTRQIAGEIERAMALAETLLLAVPSVVVLILYIRVQEAEDAGNRAEDTGNGAAEDARNRAEESGSGEKGNAPPVESAITEITSPEQLKKRMEAVEGTAGNPGATALTQREWEIAWLLYRGYTNRQIAEEFFIAETTVKKHVSHIYEKLEVSGRKEFREKYKK